MSKLIVLKSKNVKIKCDRQKCLCLLKIFLNAIHKTKTHIIFPITFPFKTLLNNTTTFNQALTRIILPIMFRAHTNICLHLCRTQHPNNRMNDFDYLIEVGVKKFPDIARPYPYSVMLKPIFIKRGTCSSLFLGLRHNIA